MNTDICLGQCAPIQIVNINFAINDLEGFRIIDDKCNDYDTAKMQLSYSIDGATWSCYNSFNDTVKLLDNIKSDFYIRVKIQGAIKSVFVNDTPTFDYSTSIASGFNFGVCDSNNTNTYNPYANLECAIALQQQLTENVACMFGIPIYYFKLSGNEGAKDLTFKEYALMNVESVKQIKLIITDGQMPSSKPEFSEFGLDWQSDWETEISKGMFATAFGNNAQPQEGDLIYIPLQKRMWMVNEAYDEKKDALMWCSTTFKLALVKYQEKGSVDLGDADEFVQLFVKNTYEDIFGIDENIEAGVESTESPRYAATNMYPVFESDATRKYVTCANNDIIGCSRYQKGTLITDYCYDFSNGADDSAIIYQHQYCGDSGTSSFIINTDSPMTYEGILVRIANISINIKETTTNVVLTLNNNPDVSLTLNKQSCYFVYLRWSHALSIVEMSASKYSHPDNIPLYKLQSYHYYFDIDNSIKSVGKYNDEIDQMTSGDVMIGKIIGTITNFKLFDVYIDNITEILMMMPTNQHLLINDTARKLIDLNGVSLR